MLITLNCDWCGREFTRPEYCLKGKRHHFCCRECVCAFSSKSRNPDGYSSLKNYANMSLHMSRMNREMNPERMTSETRKKLRDAHLGSGEGKTYTKCYGRHEHRVMAERILGRPLRPGEVVHHEDGNVKNNDPRNLFVFPSQAEHARYHMNLKYFIQELKRLDAEEVMPDEVHSA